MGKDGRTPLRPVRSIARSSRLIANHTGRIFGSAGDSVIAEFAARSIAVRCATEIQLEIDNGRRMREANRMSFRIGINLGDGVVDGDNLRATG